jgi:mannose-1-phosphate guanylyltransferase
MADESEYISHARLVPVAPWSLILAGGDGVRLRSLTRAITGEARPKQFCPLLDGETLLERTRRRVDLLSRLDHQAIVVSKSHAPYYAPLVRDLAPRRLVEQPGNRGTAAGLLYPLLRIADLAGDVPVAVFPSDHFVDDDRAFVAAVAVALDAVQARPDLVVLLGIEPSTPETEYGWIEANDRPLAMDRALVFPIRRFWEKPSAELAATLLARRCLWNSFVMVGRVSAFLGLIAAGAPGLVARFQPLRRAVGTSREADVADAVYGTLPSINFSEHVLVPCAARLGTVRVKGVAWSDLGNVERVYATIRRTGSRPRWLDNVPLPVAG